MDIYTEEWTYTQKMAKLDWASWELGDSKPAAPMTCAPWHLPGAEEDGSPQAHHQTDDDGASKHTHKLKDSCLGRVAGAHSHQMKFAGVSFSSKFQRLNMRLRLLRDY